MFIVTLRILFTLALLLEPKPAPSTEPVHFAADRPFDIKHIALDMKVEVPAKYVDATATIDLVALRNGSSVRFDAAGFDVKKVTVAHGGVAGKEAEYENDGQGIEVSFGDTLKVGTAAKVSITYSIHDPKSGLHFFAPSKSEPDVPYVMWSQGESTDNHYWVPCFDHPNEMQTTEITVTVAAGNEAVSNGKLISKVTNPDKSVTFHWSQEQPHAAYLMTLVVGEFYVEQETWRGKPVMYYVPPKEKDNLKRSFEKTPKMLELFSNLTGVEYPWDKYAQVCVEGFGGGMENTSATTLTPRTLHDARAHLDTSSDGLVSHELAHQWFGDYVTCKDWAHTWLNEGFATYMSAVWSEHDLGRDEYDYAIMGDMKSAIEGGKKAPIVDRRYENAGEMFDSRAYPKGASVLHMLRHHVGDEKFWSSVKRYLNANGHHPVETTDLREAFEEETGRSLEQFFYDWTDRAGAPSVTVSYDWSEEDKLAKATVKQTQESEAFHFPLEIEFHIDGQEPKLHHGDVAEKEHRFYFPLSKRPRMVLIDPNQAVLMELKENKSQKLWLEQLTHGPHVLDRIRAARSLEESKSDKDIAALSGALKNEKFWGVGVEIVNALGKAGGDNARDVLLASTSIEHPKVRRAVIEQLGTFLGDEKVTAALREIVMKGDASYRVEAEAVESYAKLQPSDVSAVLATALGRPSHGEEIRSSALAGLGKQPNADGLDTLIEWTRRGKPRECRQAAARALAELSKNVHLPDAAMDRIVTALTECLHGEQFRFEQSAINALRDMGRDASPAVPTLRAVAANDPSDRVRKTAKDAVEKITAATPEQVQVKELREDLNKVRDENKELRKRLEKLEGKSAKSEHEESE
ncbi:MAG: HEAT repeat domain-containing protein [Planctomycetes bacterium]|nr:HEAT repeat domain-containing protein [Planctomycetota bacterium]MBI3834557.1 HEAT repeat domain-containing protein [Planctomycetota bacterium]